MSITGTQFLMFRARQVPRPCRSGNGRSSGARRAGQDREAPKGSLDAPKRFRIIEGRSDGTRTKAAVFSQPIRLRWRIT
jgi:hypothetical protein